MANTRTYEGRLRKAVEDIQKTFITKSMLINIYSIKKTNRVIANQVYQKLESDYTNYLSVNKLINPGIDGIPNKIVVDYLNLCGINEIGLKKELKALEESSLWKKRTKSRR